MELTWASDVVRGTAHVDTFSNSSSSQNQIKSHLGWFRYNTFSRISFWFLNIFVWNLCQLFKYWFWTAPLGFVVWSYTFSISLQILVKSSYFRRSWAKITFSSIFSFKWRMSPIGNSSRIWIVGSYCASRI